MKFLNNKWSIFLSSYTNSIINKAHAKIIELYVERSEISPNKLDEIHKIDSQIESWKWTIEFNRDRQRLGRYPLITVLLALLSGIIGSLLTLFLAN